MYCIIYFNFNYRLINNLIDKRYNNIYFIRLKISTTINRYYIIRNFIK